MSAYVVLARKWRPSQFSDIVGQSHISRTLMNAIRLQRVHHAYLFTGSRGIGKTSIARIFSKVLRCEHLSSSGTAENETLRSCDNCANCKEVTSSTSVDVIEIDGASNNGVEAVREIRENAKYMPATGTRKIYIIDEVHMLTTAAFNALLKTLEEPPPHVVFIFATTEPHKIPSTILSRCQRFDYRRVTDTQSLTRLEEIAKAEGIEAEPGALALIARAGEGSMRDALSLLDQAIAFSGNKIGIEAVRESIGLIAGHTLIGTLTGIFQRKPLDALKFVDESYQHGHDLRILTRSLIEFLHATLLIQVGASRAASAAVSQEEWNELQSVAQLRTTEETEMIFQVLHQGLEWIARSPQPKAVLDVLIIKCATADALVYVGENPPSHSPSSKPTSTSLAGAGQSKLHNSENNQTASSPTTNEPIASTQSPSPNSEQKPDQKSQKTWEGLIDHTRKSRPLLASILEHATYDGAPSNDKPLLIYFSPQESYFREQLQSRVYQEQLFSLTKDYFGNPVRIQIDIKEAGESLAAKRGRERTEKMNSIRNQAQNHPIILEAKALFGGEVSKLEIREANHAELAP